MRTLHWFLLAIGIQLVVLVYVFLTGPYGARWGWGMQPKPPVDRTSFTSTVSDDELIRLRQHRPMTVVVGTRRPHRTIPTVDPVALLSVAEESGPNPRAITMRTTTTADATVSRTSPRRPVADVSPPLVSSQIQTQTRPRTVASIFGPVLDSGLPAIPFRSSVGEKRCMHEAGPFVKGMHDKALKQYIVLHQHVAQNYQPSADAAILVRCV
jgi:hypothetical protein